MSQFCSISFLNEMIMCLFGVSVILAARDMPIQVSRIISLAVYFLWMEIEGPTLER